MIVGFYSARSNVLLNVIRQGNLDEGTREFNNFIFSTLLWGKSPSRSETRRVKSLTSRFRSCAILVPKIFRIFGYAKQAFVTKGSHAILDRQTYSPTFVKLVAKHYNSLSIWKSNWLLNIIKITINKLLLNLLLNNCYKIFQLDRLHNHDTLLWIC